MAVQHIHIKDTRRLCVINFWYRTPIALYTYVVYYLLYDSYKHILTLVVVSFNNAILWCSAFRLPSLTKPGHALNKNVLVRFCMSPSPSDRITITVASVCGCYLR